MIFIVLSGFATTDLSVLFCDACQGGGAYGKTGSPRPLLWSFSLPSHPCMTTVTLNRNARRSFMTERSERMNEEASCHLP
ncbi:uncharacterized protein EpC_pEp0260040 (plasmid) [Erwinia pyrifoliae Ep1/96]|nr:uncharacterized protein EpC_pEp0260040 [Erwinia pyrifoliae Ep1/96]